MTWTTEDIQDLLRIVAETPDISNGEIAKAMGRSICSVQKKRLRLGAPTRIRRTSEPDFEERLREYARQGLSYEEIASAFGPDKEGRYFSPRSIQERGWQLGVNFQGGRIRPLPTLPQLAQKLRRAGFHLLGEGRWKKEDVVVVLPPPGSTVTRILERLVGQACQEEENVSDEF